MKKPGCNEAKEASGLVNQRVQKRRSPETAKPRSQGNQEAMQDPKAIYSKPRGCKKSRGQEAQKPKNQEAKEGEAEKPESQKLKKPRSQGNQEAKKPCKTRRQTRKESQKPRSQKTTTNQQGQPRSRKGKSHKTKKIPKQKQIKYLKKRIPLVICIGSCELNPKPQALKHTPTTNPRSADPHSITNSWPL